jgi:hypothetical protein
MKKDAPPPLTSEEIQDAIRELAKGLRHYSARVRVLELLVLEKGLATEGDIEEVEDRVSAEMNHEIGKGPLVRKKKSVRIQ